MQGSGSMHISRLPLRVSREPLTRRPRGAAGSSSRCPEICLLAAQQLLQIQRSDAKPSPQKNQKSQLHAGHTVGFPGRCQRTALASFQPPASISNRKDFQNDFQGVLGLAWTWRGCNNSQAPGGLFPSSEGEDLDSEIHQYRHFIH